MKNWWGHKTLFEINLEKIAPNGRAMILAYDQGFEHGPRDFKDNPASADPEWIIRLAKKCGFTGLVVHGGIAEKYKRLIIDLEVPLILKLNGKSGLYAGDDPYSPLLYGRNAGEAVKWAVSLAAKAVGYTVYTGSKYENQMNREFSQIVCEAHRAGLVAIGWMYPRGESLRKNMLSDDDPRAVAYGARIGMELGADIVKVKYTGSVESFREVVENCRPTMVVMSGGPKTKTNEEFLSQVMGVMEAGAAGIAVGRNVWQRSDSIGFGMGIRNIIFPPVSK